MSDVGWYAMHDHGTGCRHLHSTVQGHSGDVNNPRANDHTGVTVLPSLDEARAFAAPTSPSEPATLRTKTSYQVPGLAGTWRIRAMETTNMAADGKATLLIVREDVVPAPLIGADDAVTPQHVTGVTELEPVPSTPRVLAIPTWPEDWKAFRDAQDFVWRLDEADDRWKRSTGGWTVDPLRMIFERPYLAPLIEVEETNDAD